MKNQINLKFNDKLLINLITLICNFKKERAIKN